MRTTSCRRSRPAAVSDLRLYPATKAAGRTPTHGLPAEVTSASVRLNFLGLGKTPLPIITGSGGLSGAALDEIANDIAQLIPGGPPEQPSEMAYAARGQRRNESAQHAGTDPRVAVGPSRIACHP
jgi:NAD(P)-dependent dehydrogenase (short-subunit alcohol dehydrogenase family)